MKRFPLIIILALISAACATTSRPRANLAIDSEPTAAPTPSADTTESTESTTSDDEFVDESIDLGLEGNSGPVRIEAAMSPEGEEIAIASQRANSSKKKKTSSDDIQEDAGDDEDSPEDESDD